MHFSCSCQHFPMNFNILFTVIAVYLIAAFHHGYNMGQTNILNRDMQIWVKEVRPHKDNDTVLYWSIAVSVFPAGSAFGSLFMNDQPNCQRILLYSGFLTISSQVMLNLFKEAASLALLIIGRFLMGISVGLCSVAAPIYLSEIVPEGSRGRVLSLYQVIISVSMWISQLLSMGKATIDVKWIVTVMAGTALPAIGMVFMKFCPESPIYALITEENERKAYTILRWLRKSDRIDKEFSQMMRSRDTLRARRRLHTWSVFDIPFLVCLVVVLSEQLCGVSIFIYYSSDIFLQMGFDDNPAYSATVLMGAAVVFGAFVFLILVEIIGRKILYLASIGVLFVLTILLAVAGLSYVKDPSSEDMKFLAFGAISLSGLFYGAGVGPARWLIIAEPFSYTAKPLVASVTLFFNFVLNAIFIQIFLLLEDSVRYYIFIPFIVFDLCFFLFALFFLSGSTFEGDDEDDDDD